MIRANCGLSDIKMPTAIMSPVLTTIRSILWNPVCWFLVSHCRCYIDIVYANYGHDGNPIWISCVRSYNHSSGPSIRLSPIDPFSKFPATWYHFRNHHSYNFINITAASTLHAITNSTFYNNKRKLNTNYVQNNRPQLQAWTAPYIPWISYTVSKNLCTPCLGQKKILLEGGK